MVRVHAPTAERRIRTFHGRHGRTSDRMRQLLATVGPRRALAARSDPRRPLVLEVGCGHGEAAMGYAAADPTMDVLAVDVHTPGIAHLLETAEQEGLGNLFVERVDALELLDRGIGPGGLAGVHLFFPDPWPKARHHKRRFVRSDVLDLLADRMRAGARLLVATDVDDYAARALRHLDEHPAFEGGTAVRPAWRPITRYEAAALDARRRVTELAHRRR